MRQTFGFQWVSIMPDAQGILTQIAAVKVSMRLAPGFDQQPHLITVSKKTRKQRTKGKQKI